MAKNKYYSVPWSAEVFEALHEKDYVQTQDSIEDFSSDRVIIVDTENEFFWVADEINFDRANELSELEYLQPIVRTDYNTLLSCLN